MTKAVVLFSSGLDSTINLYKAKAELNDILALHYDYGQRAAKRESHFAKKQCDNLSIPFIKIDLPWFSHFQKSSLTNLSLDLATNVEIHNREACIESAKNVWVPNRNGVFLNIAAAFAENLGADFIIPGFNIEEAQTFSDNSKDYMDSLDKAFFYSTQNKVKMKCYTVNMNKKEIFKLGNDLNVCWENVWPCYESGELPCGKCESCSRFINAKEG